MVFVIGFGKALVTAFKTAKVVLPSKGYEPVTN